MPWLDKYLSEAVAKSVPVSLSSSYPNIDWWAFIEIDCSFAKRK